MENGFSMRYLGLLILPLLLFSFTSKSYGWSQAGHILIAQIAYDQLSLDKQKKVNELAQIIFSELSEKQKAQLNSKYPTAVVFAKVAAQPDQWNGISLGTVFLRFHALVPTNLLPLRDGSTATWHYIDTPFPQNRGCTLSADKNVEWAITNLEIAFAADKLDSSKAVEMVFLEHYIGDIHEPLHTITNVTDSCAGDRGGNNFCLKQNQNLKCTKNLHTLWDGALGFLQPGQDINNVASELEKLYPSTQFTNELNLENVDMWKNASILDDVPFIYNTPEYAEPSVIYYQNGQAIAKRQMALAGYRLGKELNALLSNGSLI